MQHLMDLRDLASRQNTGTEFARRLATLRDLFVREPSSIFRLREKGL